MIEMDKKSHAHSNSTNPMNNSSLAQTPIALQSPQSQNSAH